MRRIELIFTLLIMLSCGKLDKYSGTSSHILLDYDLEILMNKEMTDMTIPYAHKSTAEEYLSFNTPKATLIYHLLSIFIERQNNDYAGIYNHIEQAQSIDEKYWNDHNAGMICIGKFIINQHINDYKEAINDALKATESFQKSEYSQHDYLNFRLEAARGYIIIKEYEKSIELLDEVSKAYDNMHDILKAKYYDTLLNLYRQSDTWRIRDILKTIESEIPNEYVYWLNISYSYSLIEDFDNALKALNNYLIYNHKSGKSAAYYGVAAHISEKTGNEAVALENIKMYHQKTEEEYRQIINSGILLKEEKSKQEYYDARSRKTIEILLISAFFTFVIITIVFAANKRKINFKNKEIQRLELMYENKTLDKELRKALKERLDIFNHITISKLCPNIPTKKAEEELEKLLMSKDSFLESTCKAFEALHPEFSSFLCNKNLTERERGCCCLYCMGMHGNEIAAYMGLTEQSYYNYSSNIRKKLGLTEYKTNLDIYLRKKIAESLK